jgi:hypothetical protein
VWRYLRLFSNRRLPLQVRSSIYLISALVLTPSPAAPDLAHATRVTGYEPQRSGVLEDEQPAHFTIGAIHRIPSCSYRSLEPHKLAKRLACYPPRSPCAL